MANQDELLEGFCRGCLVKYDDPTDLLHYTEKNRRLFVYSTGIQVKRTDAFTFQICKDCNVNMKLSCMFKKQCRSSDRRFKSYLRLKDLGDAIDLATFVKNTDDTVKFPLLSGNSTPANQKVREDDNESTCTSIRNFMSDILQGEEMPDTEARIIKEVIEEEADLLDDSLDSHWLQDDASMSTDFRLDFSFSPFTTPHSTNADNRNIPNKQITPKLPNRNNHAKRVFQQLPTMHYDQDDNAVTVKSSNKCYGRDSQIDLDNSMEKTTFQNDDTMNDILESEDYLRHTSANNMPVRNLDLNAFATEYEISRKITKENDIGLSSFQHKSQDGRDLTTNHLTTKSVDINTFEAVCGSNRKTSEHESVSSNNSDPFNKDKSKVNRNTENELDVAVKSIHLNKFETESDTNSQTLNDNIEDMSIDSNAFETESEANRRATNELDVAISNMELSTFNTESKFTIEIVEEKETESIVNRNVAETVSEGSSKKTDGDKISVASFDLNVFGVETKDDNQTTDIQKVVKSISVNNFSLKCKEEKHANDFLEEIIDDCNEPQQDPLFEECVDKNMSDIPIAVDKIDSNLLVPLKDESNKTEFSLDDLLVSPARDVIATVFAQPKGASTPTINNILFGEKLDDSNDEDVEDDVDLDEIVQEAVKDLNVEEKNKPDELPLVLKYDLENCECKQCKKKFKSLKSLKIHLTKVHKIKFPKPKPNYKPKTCPHCGIIITDSGNYCRHLETHQKKRDGPFKCEICTVLFETEIKLRMHMKVHNLGSYQRLETDNKKESGKKYVCETCGAMFRTHSNLSMHKRRHTTAYAHKCEVCNKGFHRVVDMQVHKRRHTGERPFACPQCKNAYITKYHLVVHMRKHTEEKPYQCDYCSSKFPVKQTLVEHIRESRSCIKIRKELEKNKGADTLKCSHCLLRFPTQKKFTKHQCKKLVVDLGIPVLTVENLHDMPVVIA